MPTTFTRRATRSVALALFATSALAGSYACIGDPPPIATRGDDGGGATDGPTGDGPSSSDAGVDASLPAHCSDGTKNADESDVDCGGSCATCANGRTCAVAGDCASGACTSGKCGPWARTLGGIDDDYVYSASFDTNGDFVVAGWFRASVDFGKGAVAAKGTDDAFVAKYSRTGDLVWLKTYGVAGASTQLYSLAIGPSNDIAIAISYGASFEIDGIFTPAPVNNSIDVAVAVLDTNGAKKKLKAFGGPGNESAGVAFAPNGDVLVGGNYLGASIAIDGFSFTNAEPGLPDMFVARLRASDLGAIWAKGFGRTGDAGSTDNLYGIAALGNDVAIYAAYFGPGSISFGGAPLPNDGYWDMGLVRLDGTSGAHVWSRHLGSVGFNDLPGTLAIDGTGNVFVSGTIEGNVDLGGGGLGPGMKPFVAKYAPDGGYLWAHAGRVPAGDPATANYGQGLGLDPSGGVVASAYFLAKQMDFGGGAVDNLEDGGATDPAVFAYASDGKPTFAKSYLSTGTDTYALYRVAIDPVTSNVVVYGTLSKPHDFGTGPIASKGGYDAFIASLGRIP